MTTTDTREPTARDQAWNDLRFRTLDLVEEVEHLHRWARTAVDVVELGEADNAEAPAFTHTADDEAADVAMAGRVIRRAEALTADVAKAADAARAALVALQDSQDGDR